MTGNFSMRGTMTGSKPRNSDGSGLSLIDGFFEKRPRVGIANRNEPPVLDLDIMVENGPSAVAFTSANKSVPGRLRSRAGASH